MFILPPPPDEPPPPERPIARHRRLVTGWFHYTSGRSTQVDGVPAPHEVPVLVADPEHETIEVFPGAKRPSVPGFRRKTDR